MMVFEYIIVMGIGSFFLPFILFDGTKDMAKKLVPVFTGFLIKFIVIDIIMFFVYWLYIDQCVNAISDSGSIGNITFFATGAFNAVVAFVLTRHAPKIADTLLTGRPSLDFGELRQSMHDARAAAHDLKTVGKGAAKVGAGAVRGGVNGTINTLGHLNKALHAGKTTAANYKASHEDGGSKLGKAVGKAGAFSAGMLAGFVGDAGESLKGGVEKFLHGGKGGSGTGSGGGTSNSAYMRNGQGHNPDENNTLNTRSNPKFQNASMYDKQSDTHRNMKVGEYLGEKGTQGDAVGDNVSKFFGWNQKPGAGKQPDGNSDNKEANTAVKQAENLDPGAATEQSGSIGGKRQASGVPDGQQGSDNKEADIAEKQAEKHASDAENAASEAKDAANDAKNGNTSPQGGNGQGE